MFSEKDKKEEDRRYSLRRFGNVKSAKKGIQVGSSGDIQFAKDGFAIGVPF